MSIYVHVIYIQVLFCLSIATQVPEVIIAQGKLQGFIQTSTEGKYFHTYLGIPYAKPPIGKLRFQPPEDPEKWKGVRNAGYPGSNCLHYESMILHILRGDEDCLHLNVYTRKVTQEDEKLPVLVWIHGGGFKTGSSSPKELHGPEIIMNREVVLVSMNYRLAILGFLSTGDNVVPGNMGLKDQSFALKWVQKNIASFGGDPNKVTIFGESAGGASAHYHMLSPLSKGLFQRAISMSGTAMCSWAYMDTITIRKRATQAATLFGCSEELNEDTIDCLRKVDGHELVRKTETLEASFAMIYGPTVEKAGSSQMFLPDVPYNLIRDGKISDVPWVTGITTNEGLFFALLSTLNDNRMRRFKEDYNSELSSIFHLRHRTKDPYSVAEVVKQFYYGEKDIEEDNIKDMSEMYSDRYFVQGLYESVRLQMESGVKSPIYLYILNRNAPLESSVLQYFLANRDVSGLGVAHTEDLAFIFKSNMLTLISSEDDIKVSNHILDMIYNLGNTGNPNSAGNLTPWVKLTQTFEYTNIDVKLELKNDFPHDKMKFWSSLNIADGGKKLIDTHQEL